MKLLTEYLLSKKHNKVNSYPSPTDVFEKLCKNKKNINENIKNVIEAFKQYLEDGIFKEHVAALLDLIDKAADDGYIMNYADSLESYYMYSDGKKDSYWGHPKTIRVGNPYNMIVVNFLNLELSKPMLYTVDISHSSVEVSIYEAGSDQHMVSNIHFGLIRWSIDYTTNDINDVEKFKNSVKNRLGLKI